MTKYFKNIEALLDRAEQLDYIETLDYIFKRQDVKDKAVELNKFQLLEGRNAIDGSLPSYYFPDYRDFKSRLPHTSKRKPKEVFDFFITGKNFQDYIKAKVLDGEGILQINADGSPILSSVQSKDPNVLGLAGEYLQSFVDFVRPLFIEETRRRLFTKAQ